MLARTILALLMIAVALSTPAMAGPSHCKVPMGEVPMGEMQMGASVQHQSGHDSGHTPQPPVAQHSCAGCIPPATLASPTFGAITWFDAPSPSATVRDGAPNTAPPPVTPPPRMLG